MTESERNQRIHHHMYETCEGIQQQSERIVALEELVAELWGLFNMHCHECDEWVRLSANVGTCRLDECKRKRAAIERINELEVPL